MAITTESLRARAKIYATKIESQLTDPELREIAWTAAALDGAPVKAQGSILGAHLASEKLAYWRKSLRRKMGEIEVLKARLAEMGDVLPADTLGKIRGIEEDCDMLAEQILAEEGD